MTGAYISKQLAVFYIKVIFKSFLISTDNIGVFAYRWRLLKVVWILG